MRFYLFIFTILFSLNIAAVECETPSEPFNTETIFKVQNNVQVTCNLRGCTFVPQKMSTQAMIEAMEFHFSGRGFAGIDPEDGEIKEGRTKQSVLFWHRCKESLDALIKLAGDLDVESPPSGKKHLGIFFRVYQIQDQAISDMSVGLSGIFSGSLAETPAKASLDYNNGLSILNLAFGNLTDHLLNVRLSAAKSNNRAEKLYDYARDIIDGEPFAMRQSANIYINPKSSASTPTMESSGYTISGKVDINTSEGTAFYVLRDFELVYNEPIPAQNSEKSTSEDDEEENGDVQRSFVRKLYVEHSEKILLDGRPQIIAFESAQELIKNRGGGFPALFGKSSNRSDYKFVIFATVNSNGSLGFKSQSGAYPEISDTEVRSLPLKMGGDILKYAQFNVEPITEGTGFNIVKMNLNQKLLGQDNYKEEYTVNISNELLGAESSGRTYELQHLANFPLQFPVGWTSNKSESLTTVELKAANKKSNVSPKLVRYQLRYNHETAKIKIIDTKIR